MNIKRIPHYMKKCFQLGPRKAFKVVNHRLSIALHEKYSRQKATSGQAGVLWHHIQMNHSISSFSKVLSSLKERSLSYVDRLYSNDDKKNVLSQADAFVDKTFDLLGSGPITFETIPWHSDFRLHKNNPNADHVFDQYMFYKDIVIASGKDEYNIKDIKIPWELSRFAHLVPLGYAYQQAKHKKYANAFQEQVTDWIERNQYLLGPNWVCPMDVGIRAINLIVAFHFFKDEENFDEQFWHLFVTSLYNHMIYLEGNWEIYDGRTSNHYLSDLVGYLYLCWFFKDWSGVQKKLSWCHQEILREFDKQVFDEGSDYEGSTSYHGLVTELFYHAFLLFKECDLEISYDFENKLRRMFDFMQWCPSDLVKIGDDDSGKILFYGLTPSVIERMQTGESKFGTKKFRQFGVSIIKDKRVHISLRHHAYKKHQPSGHFHNDVGSMTLAVDGVPFIVDPGSYVYTPSSVWRNRFRSVHNHNTFSMNNVEPVPLTERLFALDLDEAECSAGIQEYVLETKHSLYDSHNLTARRRIVYDAAHERIILYDSWHLIDESKNVETILTNWNFTCAPGVTVMKKNDHEVILHNGDKSIRMRLKEGGWNIVSGWASENYGNKTSVQQIKTEVDVRPGAIKTTIIELL